MTRLEAKEKLDTLYERLDTEEANLRAIVREIESLKDDLGVVAESLDEPLEAEPDEGKDS